MDKKQESYNTTPTAIKTAKLQEAHIESAAFVQMAAQGWWMNAAILLISGFMLRLFTVIILTGLFAEVHGQHFTVFNYSVPEGLPSSEVYEVFEDRNGFMWFATDHGVVKFDGQQMRIYQMKDGLSDPVVFGFQEDALGRIWFRTFSGRLSYYENGVIKPYPFNDELQKFASNGLINFCYLPETDQLWFSVRNREGFISGDGELSVDTLSNEYYSNGMVYKVRRSGEDLLINTGRHANIDWIFINDTKYPVQHTPVSYINKTFHKVRLNGKLYLSGYNDVFEFDGSKVVRVIKEGDPVISLSTDKENNLWVGFLGGGVRRYQNGDFTTYWEPDFLKKKSVTKVYQDKNGSTWYSTLENGVFYAPNMAIVNYPLPDNARVKSVHSLNNEIIVGDKTGIVRFFDKETHAVSHQKKFDYNILSVFSDSKNNFWISGHSAIAVYDSSFRLQKLIDDRNASDFYESSEGVVWAMGAQRLFRFDQKFDLVEEQVFPIIYRNFLLHDSVFFFGGRIGMHVRAENHSEMRSPAEFANFKISDIKSLNDSTVMVSTIGNGFTLLNTLRWTSTHYDAGSKFIANNIYSTLQTDTLLWIGTEKGLAVTPLLPLLNGNPKFNYLSKSSGLGNSTINFLAEGANAVWAFYEDGFSLIPMNLARFANEKPAFYLTTIESNGKRMEFTDRLVLDSDQRNLTIGFGYISFNNPVIFQRYRINEADAWIYTDEREIDLTSLAPGSYALNLQYSADNINWYNALDPILFTVNPEWYRRWYIYPGVIVALVVLAWLYVRNQRSVYQQKNLYLKIINEHQQKLIQSEVVTVERERNRIAKELHDGIGTTLSAIKLRVSHLLENHREPMAAGEIEEQFQMTITEIKNIIYGLTPPSLERYGLFTALRNYVNRLSKNLPIAVNLKTFGYEINKYELNIIIFRVIQELLSNSVKHSYAKNISIHLSSFDDVISIIYEDDGIGFKYDPLRNGLGLDSIESRIQSINGTLKFDSGNFGISYTIEIPITLKKEVI